IAVHFAAEEAVLFPAAANFPDVQTLVQELLAEHAVLRNYFAGASARELDAQNLAYFGDKLAQHIRKEERQLFEAMQDVSQACALPSEATKLRPRTISHPWIQKS